MQGIDSIHHQQRGQLVRNSALRKAAGSPRPPELTDDEASLIRKKFTARKPMNLYNMRGDVRNNGFGRGRHVDTRV